MSSVALKKVDKKMKKNIFLLINGSVFSGGAPNFASETKK